MLSKKYFFIYLLVFGVCGVIIYFTEDLGCLKEMVTLQNDSAGDDDEPKLYFRFLLKMVAS